MGNRLGHGTSIAPNLTPHPTGLARWTTEDIVFALEFDLNPTGDAFVDEIAEVVRNTNGPKVGQAYLFDATTGALLRTFDDPAVTGADGFGFGGKAAINARARSRSMPRRSWR